MDSEGIKITKAESVKMSLVLGSWWYEIRIKYMYGHKDRTAIILDRGFESESLAVIGAKAVMFQLGLTEGKPCE